MWLCLFGRVQRISLESDAMAKEVLVIEDSEGKWKEVQQFFVDHFGGQVALTHAATLVDAEDAVAQRTWDLVLLDVSMDIAASATGRKGGGHDPLGGLGVASKMYLLGKEAPTVIFTGFTSFPSGESKREGSQILGLEDVEARAKQVLGAALLGCIRYGDADWKERLCGLVEGALT